MYLSGLDEGLIRIDNYTTMRSLGVIMSSRVQGWDYFICRLNISHTGGLFTLHLMWYAPTHVLFKLVPLLCGT